MSGLLSGQSQGQAMGAQPQRRSIVGQILGAYVSGGLLNGVGAGGGANATAAGASPSGPTPATPKGGTMGSGGAGGGDALGAQFQSLRASQVPAGGASAAQPSGADAALFSLADSVRGQTEQALLGGGGSRQAAAAPPPQQGPVQSPQQAPAAPESPFPPELRQAAFAALSDPEAFLAFDPGVLAGSVGAAPSRGVFV